MDDEEFMVVDEAEAEAEVTSSDSTADQKPEEEMAEAEDGEDAAKMEEGTAENLEAAADDTEEGIPEMMDISKIKKEKVENRSGKIF